MREQDGLPLDQGISRKQLHPNTRAELKRIKEAISQREKNTEDKDSAGAYFARGMTDWLKQHTKKEVKKKPKLKPKPEIKQKLGQLAQRVEQQAKKAPKIYAPREALGYDEKFGQFTKISRKILGQKKNETDAERRKLERISIRGLKARAWQKEHTLRYLKDTDKISGRVDIPSHANKGERQEDSLQAVAGTRLHSEQTVEQFRGTKQTIHILAPGVGGSAGGRWRGENGIGVTIEDAVALKERGNGRPYYLWRNLNAMSHPQRKQFFINYCSSLVMCLEARLGCRIDDCTWSGHSGGGEVLNRIAECFPDFKIPLTQKNPDGTPRYLQIKAICAADSAYKGNAEFCYSYVGKGMKKELLKRLDKNNTALGNALADYRKNPSQDNKEKVEKEILKVSEKVTVQYIKTFLLAILHKGDRSRLSQVFDSRPPDEILPAFLNLPTDEALNKIMGGGYILLAKGHKSIKTSGIPYQMIKGMKAIIPFMTDHAIKGTLSELIFPKYFASVEDNGWRHQYRVNRFALAMSGKSGIKAHNIADRYPDSSFSKDMTGKQKSKKRHWYAWGKYSREFLDFANG